MYGRERGAALRRTKAFARFFFGAGDLRAAFFRAGAAFFPARFFAGRRTGFLLAAGFFFAPDFLFGADFFAAADFFLAAVFFFDAVFFFILNFLPASFRV